MRQIFNLILEAIRSNRKILFKQRVKSQLAIENRLEAIERLRWRWLGL